MNTRGFTLLELVIALVLLGTVAAIALPAFSASQIRMAVRHAADEFRATHSLAQSLAIRDGRVAQLHIDAGTDSYWLEMDTSVSRTGATDTIGTVKHLSGDRVMLSSTRVLLCFDGRGLATPVWNCPPGDATLVFSRADQADTVTTTVVGMVLR